MVSCPNSSSTLENITPSVIKGIETAGTLRGRVRIFKTKVFARFARKADIDDKALRKAVAEAEKGLIDVDLGGGVIKKRVARTGGGKSGGFRTIVLFHSGERAVFAYGYAKNERDNIGDDELRAFKTLAAKIMAYDDAAIVLAVASSTLIEVPRNE